MRRQELVSRIVGKGVPVKGKLRLSCMASHFAKMTITLDDVALGLDAFKRIDKFRPLLNCQMYIEYDAEGRAPYVEVEYIDLDGNILSSLIWAFLFPVDVERYIKKGQFKELNCPSDFEDLLST